MNGKPSLVVQDLRMDELSHDWRRHRDNSTLGEKRDEPARPSRVLRRYAAPPPGPRAPAVMAGEAVDGLLADVVQLQASGADPRRKVSGRIRIAADR
jgi:hypothetical protein